MKCPSCGLYHPAFYERCVACGISFAEPANKDTEYDSQEATADISAADQKTSVAKIRFASGIQEKDTAPWDNVRSDIQSKFKSGFQSGRLEQIRSISTKRGVFIALLILLVFAGATAFFLSRSPDDQRLLALGKQQLSLGQYAFAVQTLTKVSALRPNDPNVSLALARAYVGVDQLDEAWDCITHAQQLGVGVVADPALASELANYYKQHGQYEKAIDLLRPLANASVPGKKGELADLDALWGDDCIEQGKLDQAKLAWEEVQQLNEGMRATEAKSRLATVYLKLVDAAYANQDDAKALDYLNKVNALEENTRNYLLAADICERDGKLKEAIEQIQKALKLKADDQFIKSRLAQLYLAEGKELIQLGNDTEGYGYLQQVSSLDPAFAFPAAVLKNLALGVVDGKAKIAGELWNASNKTISTLTMKVQLYDNTKGVSLWQKEQRLVDEFVPPITPQQTKSFIFLAPLSNQKPEALVFRVYLDGNFYGEYPVKAGAKMRLKVLQNPLPNIIEGQTNSKPSNEKALSPESHLNLNENNQNNVDHNQPNEAELAPKQNKKAQNEPTVSPEEKTMKDLEF